MDELEDHRLSPAEISVTAGGLPQDRVVIHRVTPSISGLGVTGILPAWIGQFPRHGMTFRGRIL